MRQIMQPTVSRRRGIAQELVFNTASAKSVTGETVQFYYNNSGTLTADAGQAIGTLVVAKLAYNQVLNALGDSTGIFNDTSLSFTSTAFTTEINVGATTIQSMDELTTIEKFNYINTILIPNVLTTNGQFFVDYGKGLLFGLKASTQSSLASAAYLVPQPI